MELAARRFGFAFVVSAALHAAVAVALLRSMVLAPAVLPEPAAIQIDLRWVEAAAVATASRLGSTLIAASPPPAVEVTAPVSVAVNEPSPPRHIRREEPTAGIHGNTTAPRSKQKAATDAGRSSDDSPSEDRLAALASDLTQRPVAAGEHGSPGAGSGSTAPTLGSAIRVRYEQQLYVWLTRFKQYPMLARSRGIEGTASVRVRVDRDGRVLARSVEKSTGERLLDDAAVEMTHRADPFPPVPGSYSGDSFEFVAPIEFRLR